ncbi:RAD52 family DNA repair protein [Paracoccus homiensis]|uniref:Recombination protein rad52 n=1 Tax=Paracoccus homiensis TaxID=364199 RepID=A0A1I0J0H2_9RHOB|nr:RAD52 family DNA repair protein [Paracoccus homiensis]SEU02517.1 recombination protein rad52 [Paracoccus homiensis]
MIDWEKATEELARKLDPKHIKPAKQFGPKGDYIEGWHAMAEANRIFGHGAWSYTVIKCDAVMQQERKIGKAQKDGWGVTYVATVRVTVDGVIREDVGAGHGYDADLGLAHESAVKEAVTDALKRGLRGFGNPFGLALYDKSRENVGVDLPPMDHAAEAARIIDRLEQAGTVAELGALWKSESATIAAVKAAYPAAYKAIEDAKDKMKTQLAPPPAGPDEGDRFSAH